MFLPIGDGMNTLAINGRETIEYIFNIQFRFLVFLIGLLRFLYFRLFQRDVFNTRIFHGVAWIQWLGVLVS